MNLWNEPALGSVLNKDSSAVRVVIQGFRIEGAVMRKQLYWLSDEDWRRIEALLPRGRRGAHRVDDRRVISGVLHMLRSGARWRDCPPEYGPYTTIYNRFNRWSKQGVWEAIFYKLTGSSGVVSSAAIDTTHIKAHRSAGGAKGGLLPRDRPLKGRADQQNPRADRRGWSAAGLCRDRRQHA
jgi:transposase